MWIYSAYDDVDTENPDSPLYCHPTCYWFAFWLTTSVYIVSITMCCCLACVGLCTAVWPQDNSRIEHTNDEENATT